MPEALPQLAGCLRLPRSPERKGRGPRAEVAGSRKCERACRPLSRKAGNENAVGREEQTEEKGRCGGKVSGAWHVYPGEGGRSGARAAKRWGGVGWGGAWRGVAEFVASVSRDDPDGGVRGNLTGDYVVGQVASSLFQGKRPCRDSTARLASLFSSLEPQPQPVYLRVPKVSHRLLFRMAR